ncbi:uncharacterized protein B0H18DRAFT_626263 [Fomitopsis serialis]|uniref:uncharacterized protein n=1 Tax=Fomitopsis serialis TaxID=139415 RepID=UPI0020079CF8|nr:uncharacterized protein B0H18DRAFT_626263 [Neoantrodia serialis]KAH9919722.1 hypothetical protein B0H18DRAFT_626263 [Neoantrodia serialis]
MSRYMASGAGNQADCPSAHPGHAVQESLIESYAPAPSGAVVEPRAIYAGYGNAQRYAEHDGAAAYYAAGYGTSAGTGRSPPPTLPPIQTARIVRDDLAVDTRHPQLQQQHHAQPHSAVDATQAQASFSYSYQQAHHQSAHQQQQQMSGASPPATALTTSTSTGTPPGTGTRAGARPAAERPACTGRPAAPAAPALRAPAVRRALCADGGRGRRCAVAGVLSPRQSWPCQRAMSAICRPETAGVMLYVPRPLPNVSATMPTASQNLAGAPTMLVTLPETGLAWPATLHHFISSHPI